MSTINIGEKPFDTLLDLDEILTVTGCNRQIDILYNNHKKMVITYRSAKNMVDDYEKIINASNGLLFSPCCVV